MAHHKDKTNETTSRPRQPWNGPEPPGDPFLFRDLLRGERRSDSPRLAEMVPAGTRAVGLDLPAERAVNGLLAPGDLVDVVASVGDSQHAPGGGGRPPALIAYTVLHGLEVLSSTMSTARLRASRPGRDFEQSREAPRGERSEHAGEPGRVLVTLAAALSEVERLVTAAESGSLWLALVPAGEPRPSRPLDRSAVKDDGGGP